MSMTPERARELTGHTPGPLVVSFESVDPEWAIVSTYGGRIVANVHCDCLPGGFRDDANARLIAAAPDLLAGYLALVSENERLRTPPQITDAMVEAYIIAISTRLTGNIREDVRAALTAALASTPVDTSRGGMG